jgi:GDP-L-fucose synthase
LRHPTFFPPSFERSTSRGNFTEIRRDRSRRPIEGVNREADDQAILEKLANYGLADGRVEIYGTGPPMREFLWSEEMADACVFVMERADFRDTFPEGAKEIRRRLSNDVFPQ